MATWVVEVRVNDDCDTTSVFGVVEADTTEQAEQAAERWARDVENRFNEKKWEDFATTFVVSVNRAVRVS